LGLKIFIVDDHAAAREALSACLTEQLEVDVVGVAQSEREAVAWLRTHPRACHLVILDIMLADGSGIGVLESIDMRRQGLVCAVFTNYPQTLIAQRCKQLGAVHVFDKSLQIDALVALCRDMSAQGLQDLQ
jgi:DNA-binding NarL/FixJ family response regulator